MHEVGLCQAICDTVTDHAGGRPVERVVVRVGHLRQVVPDTLRWSWELVVADSPLCGCRLEVEHVPAVVTCRTCGTSTTLDWPVPACAACGSVDVELVSGDELLVVAIDVVDGVGSDAGAR